MVPTNGQRWATGTLTKHQRASAVGPRPSERRDRQGCAGVGWRYLDLDDLDADNKLAVSWLVGGRDSDSAGAFHRRRGEPSDEPRAADERRSQGLPRRGRGCVWRRCGLRAARQAVRGRAGERERPLQPGRMHSDPSGPRSKERPTRSTSARPTSSARTSRCGCTGASPGSPTHSPGRSRTRAFGRAVLDVA